jgi:hypothetical protein
LRNPFTKHGVAIAVIVLTLALSACSEGALGGVPTPSTEDDNPDQLATLVESGFGQDGPSVWMVAIVTHAQAAVGLGVTVRFKLLDKHGKVLATASQEERFSWDGQKLPIATSVQLPQPQAKHSLRLLPAKRVKSMETSLTTRSTHTQGSEPFEPFEARLGPDRFGEPRVFYTVDNPSTQNRARLRIQEVCRDSAGDIIGGSTHSPVLIGRGSTVHTWSIVTVSREPAECTIYPAPDTGTAYPGPDMSTWSPELP